MKVCELIDILMGMPALAEVVRNDHDWGSLPVKQVEYVAKGLQVPLSEMRLGPHVVIR